MDGTDGSRNDTKSPGMFDSLCMGLDSSLHLVQSSVDDVGAFFAGDSNSCDFFGVMFRRFVIFYYTA